MIEVRLLSFIYLFLIIINGFAYISKPSLITSNHIFEICLLSFSSPDDQ
jgi:hypothetical protein